MAESVNYHAIYMNTSFRPMVMPDGSFKRVGVQANGPICFDPEVYPNLLLAAPAMYQALSALKPILHLAGKHREIEAVEAVMAFAQNGYLGGVEITEVIKGLQK